MKYTSLTHSSLGDNTQRDFDCIEDWEDDVEFSFDVVWSKIYEARSGILVKSYWPDEFKEYRGENK